MSEPLEIPEELQHLIEKRDREDDRRQNDSGPPDLDGDSAIESSEKVNAAERRKDVRRGSDQNE